MIFKYECSTDQHTSDGGNIMYLTKHESLREANRWKNEG